MKSGKKLLLMPDAGAMSPAYPEQAYLPGDEESDAKCVVLERITDQGSHESTHFPYREDREEPDYIDEHALHRLVEDLQFGHDLRL